MQVIQHGQLLYSSNDDHQIITVNIYLIFIPVIIPSSIVNSSNWSIKIRDYAASVWSDAHLVVTSGTNFCRTRGFCLLILVCNYPTTLIN